MMQVKVTDMVDDPYQLAHVPATESAAVSAAACMANVATLRCRTEHWSPGISQASRYPVAQRSSSGSVRHPSACCHYCAC